MQNIYAHIITSTFLLIFASCFSLLETAIISISTYKLNILKDKHQWAKYALKFKNSIDKMLIFSLFGNSLFNAIFTTITTFWVIHIINWLSESLVLSFTTAIIAFFIIIFSEVIPKTIASKVPIRVLRFVSIPLYYIYILSLPIILIIDKVVFFLTKFMNIKTNEVYSLEEIKAIIEDQKFPFRAKHRKILLNSMKLESFVVKEVLIPLRLVEGININDTLENLIKQLYTCHHTRVIVFQDTIDNIIGFVHVKDMLAINKHKISKKTILDIIRPIVFVNEFIPIIKQINHAEKTRNRIFVVINEYADVLGIACLEDMLELIFGNFTTLAPSQRMLAIKTNSNEIVVDGIMLVRELNELYDLNIKIDLDALTINGLVIKKLGSLPQNGVCFRLNNLIFEILSMGNYWVERVKITIL